LNSVIVDMQRKLDSLKAKLELYENAGILGNYLLEKYATDPEHVASHIDFDIFTHRRHKFSAISLYDLGIYDVNSIVMSVHHSLMILILNKKSYFAVIISF
jgi:hypothetical protein